MGHIALVGDMAVGKTTLGRLLAAALGRPFLDSDDVIEAEGGMTAAEIAARHGVGALHDRELEVFGLMIGSETPSVLAPAASVVDRERGRDLFHGCITIWLVATDAILEERLEEGGNRRSSSYEERVASRERRHSYLEQIADIKVDTARVSPEELVDEVVEDIRDLS